MRKCVVWAALMTLLLVGCSKEKSSFEPQLQVPQRFSISIEGSEKSDSRASLGAADDTGLQATLWQAGDCVSIFPECNDNHEYKTEADGQTYGEFEHTGRAEIKGNPAQSHAGLFYAVSPWHEMNTMVDGIVSLNLLAEQSAPQNQPMPEVLLMTSKSETENFSMKNNVALLRFRFSHEGLEGLVVEQICITSEGHLLAGRGEVDPAADSPSILISEGSKQLTFTPSDTAAVKLAEEGYIYYYAAIAPGDYDDLVIEFKTNKGTYINNIVGSMVSCKRSKYFTFNKTFRPDELIGDTSTSPYIEGDQMEL